MIMKIRGENEYGDTSVRPRITPKLNLQATSLTNLISWEDTNVYEPVYTCSLPKKNIKDFVSKPCDPPNFLSHSQATECCMKLGKEAAAAVCGPEARDGYIRARIAHRSSLPIFLTKKDILDTF